MKSLWLMDEGMNNEFYSLHMLVKATVWGEDDRKVLKAIADENNT